MGLIFLRGLCALRVERGFSVHQRQAHAEFLRIGGDLQLSGGEQGDALAEIGQPGASPGMQMVFGAHRIDHKERGAFHANLDV